MQYTGIINTTPLHHTVRDAWLPSVSGQIELERDSSRFEMMSTIGDGYVGEKEYIFDTPLMNLRQINPFLCNMCPCEFCEESDEAFRLHVVLHVMTCRCWGKCSHRWCCKRMAQTIVHAAFCENGDRCTYHCRALKNVYRRHFHPTTIFTNPRLRLARILFFHMLMRAIGIGDRHKKKKSIACQFLYLISTEPALKKNLLKK